MNDRSLLRLLISIVKAVLLLLSVSTHRGAGAAALALRKDLEVMEPSRPRHNAVITGTCQTGCTLELRVNGKKVAEFCVSVPES